MSVVRQPGRANVRAERKSVTPSQTLREPPRPQRIGPYRPHGVLGAGGMATVYWATGGAQLGTRRVCALKVLRDNLSEDENYLNMFFNEAKIASEIAHPHVCGVFDYGSAGGHAYLAMEYVRGKSLAAIFRTWGEISDPQLHAQRIARVLADACEGLSAIHEHRSPQEVELRVVHRDVSLDNLILGFDGFVKVIDFGLAKIGGRGEKTQSGILKGKVSYIAPELLHGDRPTQGADIWALGVVAWELLTGKRLFRKDTDAETLRAILQQPIEAPSKVLPGLPSNLDAIVLRALARDPNQRYPSMAEFGAALWGFLRTRGELVQHRDLRAWLAQLFPGEEESFRARLESVAHAPVLSLASNARRSRELLGRVRARIGRALPARRQSRWAMAVLVAGACFGWAGFQWSNAHARPLSNNHTALAAFGGLNASGHERAGSDGNFAVEVERASDGSEVTVHVRAEPTRGSR